MKIEMSWKLALDYAMKSGMIINFLISFALILLATFIVIKSKNAKWGDWRWIIVTPIIILSVVMVYAKPGGIKWNNEKEASIETYNYYKAQDASFKTFYDSLYDNNLLVDAPNPDHK